MSAVLQVEKELVKIEEGFVSGIPVAFYVDSSYAAVVENFLVHVIVFVNPRAFIKISLLEFCINYINRLKEKLLKNGSFFAAMAQIRNVFCYAAGIFAGSCMYSASAQDLNQPNRPIGIVQDAAALPNLDGTYTLRVIFIAGDDMKFLRCPLNERPKNLDNLLQRNILFTVEDIARISDPSKCSFQ